MKTTGKRSVPKHPHARGDAVEVLAGATAGAVAGSIAGPVGAVTGGVIGAAIGAAAARVLDDDTDAKTAHEIYLDEVTGIIGETDPDDVATIARRKLSTKPDK